MVIQCCVCKKIRCGDQWVDIHWADLTKEKRISHGYCPACAQEAYETFRQVLAMSEREMQNMAY